MQPYSFCGLDFVTVTKTGASITEDALLDQDHVLAFASLIEVRLPSKGSINAALQHNAAQVAQSQQLRLAMHRCLVLADCLKKVACLRQSCQMCV